MSYCNQTTAWITLLEPEQSERVVSELIESNRKTAIGLSQPYSVVTWSTFEYTKRLNKDNLLPPSRSTASLSQKKVAVATANEAVSKMDRSPLNEFCDPPRKKKKECTSSNQRDSVTDSPNTFESTNIEHSTKKRLEYGICEYIELSTFLLIIAKVILMNHHHKLDCKHSCICRRTCRLPQKLIYKKTKKKKTPRKIEKIVFFCATYK